MRDQKDREIEVSFWESVRSSDNPALIQAYLEKYPEGEFSALAQLRIDELKEKSEEPSLNGSKKVRNKNV